MADRDYRTQQPRHLDGPVWSAADQEWLATLSADQLRSMVYHLSTSPLSARARVRAARWHVIRRQAAEQARGGAA